MTHDQLEGLSNLAVFTCGAVYFLAFLSHLVAFAAGRQVGAVDALAAADEREEARVPVGAGAASAPAQPAPATPEEPEKMATWSRIGIALTVVAAAVQLVAVVSRGLAADPVRVPWGNMYEFALTGTLVVVLGYLGLYRRYGLAWLSPVVTGFVLVVLMVDVTALYSPVVPLRDALQSPWLVIHVIAATMRTLSTNATTIGAIHASRSRW